MQWAAVGDKTCWRGARVLEGRHSLKAAADHSGQSVFQQAAVRFPKEKNHQCVALGYYLKRVFLDSTLRCRLL